MNQPALNEIMLREVENRWELPESVLEQLRDQRAYLKLALATWQVIQREQPEGEESDEARRIIETLRDAVASLPAKPHQHREVAGHRVKVIASNIRKEDFAWEDTELLKEGLGQEGDIVLAEVVTNQGSKTRIENIHGRDERIYRGNRVLAVLGNRHSGTSEYGGIPEEGWDIQRNPDVDLLCNGGIVGRAESIPEHLGKTATRLRLKGLVGRAGKPLNVRDLHGKWNETLKPSAPLIALCGTSAEIGKTTAAAAIIRQLKQKGLKIGAAKLAGTGRYRDLLELRDAGADIFMDFPDVGLPSTYTSAARYLPAIITLLNRLNRESPDVIVAEFGGDIIEANIPSFFEHPELRETVRAIIHASGDIMGMQGAMTHYKAWRVCDRPIVLTYPIGRNRAGSKNRIEKELGLAVFNPMDEQETGQITEALLQQIQKPAAQ